MALSESLQGDVRGHSLPKAIKVKSKLQREGQDVEDARTME